MKRETIGQVCIVAMLSLLLMLLLPLCVMYFASAEQALNLLVLLYYWLDPIFAAGVGIFAGKSPKRRWFLTLIPAVLYPFLAWASSGTWMATYIQVAGCYLLIGLAATGISYAIRRLRKG